MKASKKYAKLATKMKHSSRAIYTVNESTNEHIFSDGCFALFTADPETIKFFMDNVKNIRKADDSTMQGLYKIKKYANENCISCDPLANLTDVSFGIKGTKADVYYVNAVYSCQTAPVGAFAIFDADYMPADPDKIVYIGDKNTRTSNALVRTGYDTMIICPINYDMEPGAIGAIVKSIIDSKLETWSIHTRTA